MTKFGGFYKGVLAMTNFTVQQKKAIDARGSLLISAGAGSGKTLVLVEHLMDMIINDGCNIDDFVIITFTKATAAELKSKITKRILSELSACPDNSTLNNQIALLRQAKIGTIHAFCGNLLREYSIEAGVSPAFKIISDEHAFELKKMALDRVMNDAYKNMSSEFVQLVNTIGIGTDDKLLCNTILDVYEKMQSHADPKEWAESVVSLFDSSCSDLENSPFAKIITDNLNGSINHVLKEMTDLLEIISQDDQLYKAYGSSFEVSVNCMTDLAAQLSKGGSIASPLEVDVFPRLGQLKNYEDTELSEYIKKKRDACKKTYKKLVDSICIDYTTASVEMTSCSAPMHELVRIVNCFDEQYSKLKENETGLDYSDLEHKTYEMLKNHPELADRISNRYSEILVDEFQDVSQIQNAIFNSVSNDGKKLFLVGDVKQSIYSFRLADPEIFVKKLDDTNQPKVFLSDNFRSRREIIDCANKVFSHCMTRNLGGIDYDGDQSLKFGAVGYTGTIPSPEIHIFEKADDTYRVEHEAEKVADMISELLPELQKNNQSYGDIAILLRSCNNVSEIYARTLLKRGIPVSSSQSEAFFVAPEINYVIALLEILDNPHRDIPLLTVLTSPIINFNADDLSSIRTADKYSDLFTALMKSNLDKAVKFLEFFNNFRDRCCDMSTESIIRTIYDETDIVPICSGMSDGSTRVENLRKILQLAVAYEKDGYHGLHGFVSYLHRLSEKGLDLSASGKTDAVRIMSIHKSKGLEFPVVFLCDTTHKFNHKDNNNNVLIHPELGFGPKYTDEKRHIQYSTLARTAISVANTHEMLSEEMRLLYVALTRAKERLYMIATAEDPDNLISKSKAINLADVSSPIYWLLASYENVVVHYIESKETSLDGAIAVEDISVDKDVYNQIKEKLSYQYPYTIAEELPSKVTATRLKQLTGDTQPLVKFKHSFRNPDFDSIDNISAATRGTITHMVLEHISLDTMPTKNDIESEIEKMVSQKFITEDQSLAIDINAIERFFDSNVGKTLIESENVKREFRFSVLLDAEELLGKAPGEKILLQGTVDCCIVEEDGITIVDYKTDNVRTEKEIDERVDLYRPQIYAYSLALSKIFNQPIKSTVLFFLTPGIEKTIA